MEISQSFVDRAIEVNDAYGKELNAQILKNALRARDRQPRSYTSLSDLKITPTSSLKESANASGIGLGNPGNNAGNPVGNPWVVLGGGREITSGANIELTFSAKGTNSKDESIYHNPVSIDEFLNYYNSGWPRDIVTNVMIGSVRKRVDDYSVGDIPGKVLGKIKQDGQFEVLLKRGGNDIFFCLEKTDCEPDSKAGQKTTGWTTLLSRTGSDPFASNILNGRVQQELEPTSSSLYDVTANANKARRILNGEMDYVLLNNPPRDEGMLVCTEDGAHSVITALEKLGTHVKFKCQAAELYSPPNPCAELDVDGKCKTVAQPNRILFYARNDGLYIVNLNSIDNMIYELGESLRANGVPKRTVKLFSSCLKASPNSTDCAGIPLLKVTGSQKITNNCKSTYAAQVLHNNELYYAGPPQKYESEARGGKPVECRQDDRSGTVLTLINEVVRLREVNAELRPSGVFFRN